MKKYILSVIFLLGLFFSINAQELTVTIDGTVGELRKTTSKNVPAFCANNWAITQQFYTAEEICKSHGTIESIAFKTAEVEEETEKYPFTRNLIVYIVNTEEYAIDGNIMKRMSGTDQVFSGNVEFSYNSWVTIDIDDFEYTGKNILICVNDVSGTNVAGGITFDAFVGPAMIGENNAYRALYKRSISGAFDATTAISGASTILDTPVPFVQLTFKEGTTGEYLDPAQPTNFTATALSESEILLTWNSDANTSSYDVCKNAEVLANISDTSYIVKGLPLGWHCFKIVGVNGVKRSEASEIQCVELVEIPEEPEEPGEEPEEPESPEIPEDGIEELTSSLLLYPNPANDKLNIVTEVEVEEVVVYDVYGRQQNNKATRQQGMMTVEVSKLNDGVYFIMIKTNEGIITKRFVKN